MKKLLAVLLLLPTLLMAKPRTLELNENNTISFNQVFTAGYVATKQIEAMILCSKNIGKEINIVLNTPGGSISAGQLYFDTLNALPCTFNTITLFSASMGYQTVQNLGKRYILPSGTLMSHRASISGLSGELGGELDSIMELLKNNVKEMELVAAKRVGISLEKYRSDISDELWLTGSEAVKKGHADEVILVKCDSSLMSSRIERYNSLFGPLLVEFSNCPIITAPLGVRRARNAAQVKSVYDDYENMKKRVLFTL
jgi:ATP-dependent Clp protease protease subunit